MITLIIIASLLALIAFGLSIYVDFIATITRRQLFFGYFFYRLLYAISVGCLVVGIYKFFV